MVAGSAASVVAKVYGGQVYDVRLTCSPNGLTMACSCPYDRSEYCKHIWAAILAADEQRYLTDATAGKPRQQAARPASPPAAPVWKQQLNRVALLAASTHRSRATVWPAGSEIIYLLDARKSRDVNMVVVTIARRDGEAAEGRGSPPGLTPSMPT